VLALIASCALVTTSAIGYAEVPVESAATPTPLPPRGPLASTTNRGYGTQSSPSQWGGFELEGKHNSPVTASVYRGKRTNWELKVFNNSDDFYTVTIALEQLGKSDVKVKVDSFTFSLKAGEHQSRSVPMSASAMGAVANLVSWKKVAKKATVVPTAATRVPTVIATPPKPRATPASSGFEEWPQRPVMRR